MANKILMPKLSPTMEEGQISDWVKAEGDSIEENETIAEVDTDKATMEMTSLEAGTLLKILVPAGENARLGQTIGIIGEEGEDCSALLKEVEKEATSNGGNAVQGSESEVQSQESPELAKAVSAPKTVTPPNSELGTSNSELGTSNDRLLVSPIAAKMASENKVNLKSISGSGPNGRIIKRDIEAAIEGGTSSGGSLMDYVTVTTSSPFRDENTTPIRRVIAQRLGESIGPIPTFYLTTEVEMDNALGLRKAINESIAPDRVSVNDVIVKVAAAALMKHPYVNASYQGDTIRFYEDADIGIAVAIDDGLITPIVRGANKKGFSQIGGEIRELAARARDKKLLPEEYQGATFSISNLGMFGIKEFTAIINPPEAAILAIGIASPTPVIHNGQMTVRNIMHVTMSCDHRVVDGATGAKFLKTFREMLENPAIMML